MLTSGHLVTKTNKELKIKMTLDLRSVFQGYESILFHYLNQAMLAASIQWRTDLTLTQCTDHTALKWIGLLKPSRRPPDSPNYMQDICPRNFSWSDIFTRIFFSRVLLFSTSTKKKDRECVLFSPEGRSQESQFLLAKQINIPGINLQCISL